MIDAVWPTVACFLVAAGLLVANYIAVTVQERRAGEKSRFDPAQVDPALLRELQALIMSDELKNATKIEWVKAAREKTRFGLQESKDLIEYLIARSNLPFDDENGEKKAPPDDITDQGLRRLIAQGRLDEAVETYRRFTGVDVFSARDAVETLRHEMKQSDRGIDEHDLRP